MTIVIMIIIIKQNSTQKVTLIYDFGNDKVIIAIDLCLCNLVLLSMECTSLINGLITT